MKNQILSLLACICMCVSACKSEKTPPIATSLAEVQKILVGKKWKLVDVGIVNVKGSASVKVVETETKVLAPINVEWLSTMDFSKKMMPESYKNYQESAQKISFDIAEKGKIKTTGIDLDAEERYEITDKKDDKNRIGIRLIIGGKSKRFSFGGEMGDVDYTYFILGIDKKRLYLDTPSSFNEQKVVYLLEAI